MTKRVSTYLGSAVAVLALLAAGPAAAGPRHGAGLPPRLDAKVDKGIRDAVAESDADTPVRVIVRVDPGSRAAVKQALAGRGRKVGKEHALISALSLEVPANDIAGLADTYGVTSVSLD